MRKPVCLLLSVLIFSAGCAGREANLVQIRQLGDEQKTCNQLRTEMIFIQNEIARLLPKSDKTGKNIALGATGILLIVPLFFMDLKQGEQKEIEAYKQRHNHLLMITQQMDCKLPPAVTKETAELKQKGKVAEASSEEIANICKNCDRKIGNLEKTYSFTKNQVCADCFLKLKDMQAASAN